MSLKNEICTLPPFEREEILSAQALSQELGWYISAFNLPDAWKVTCGEGVKVAVLDTGADLTHPDLAPNLLPGFNFINPSLPPEDDNGHGAHVSGIIAACNNNEGMVGVAHCCKIMPIKVLNRSANGNMENVVKGINWAVENGADIITMSLGTRNPLDEVRDAIIKAREAGVVTFVAAGNAGATNTLLYPAAYTECISVGAIDENSFRADFSCTGPNLDFVAPGVKILSTVPKGWYAIMSGTSMACPFTVGVAALILAYKRKANPNARLTADEYRLIMRQNTMQVKNLDNSLDRNGRRFFEGFGIINPDDFEAWVEMKKVEAIKKDMEAIKEKIELLKIPEAAEELSSHLEEVQIKIEEKKAELLPAVEVQTSIEEKIEKIEEKIEEIEKKMTIPERE